MAMRAKPKSTHTDAATQAKLALAGAVAVTVCGLQVRSVLATEANTIPSLRCMDRPKGVEPPPIRPAPTPRASGLEAPPENASGTLLQGRGFKALCSEGKVPLNQMEPAGVSVHTPKGNPLLASDPLNEYLKFEGSARGAFIRRHVHSFQEAYGRSQNKSDGSTSAPAGPSVVCDGVVNYGSCYYYGSAGFSITADGGGMTQSIDKPRYVNAGGPGHTLNELAVQGGDRNGNIVELGWLVSSEQYGNSNPHLFVFHWRNWNQTCYDTCGWIQWSNIYYPGIDLAPGVGKTVYIGYVLYKGNWWAWFDNQWLGYFPGNEWGGLYAKTSLLQWFGEVASANGTPPETAMGDSLFPSSPAAASMSTLCDVDVAQWVCWYRDLQSLTRTAPRYYDINRLSFGATRYGGPGE